MNSKKALIVTINNKHNVKSGLSNRVEDIANFLERIGFEVEIVSNLRESSLDYYALICISSFTNVFENRSARNKCDFLWFDAMDSWRLTRKSLYLDNPAKESLKVARELFGRLFVRLADVVTYCSERDAKEDNIDLGNVIIFGPSKVSPLKLKEHSRRFVFVGPSSYYPNRQAVNYLYSLARSGIFKEVNLHIFGDSLEYRESHPDVMKHGLSSDEMIYGKSDIHLVPIWEGAGIKYKALNPLSLGIQVIASLEGSNGIVSHSKLHSCYTKRDFTERVMSATWSEAEGYSNLNLIELDQRELLQKYILESLKNL